MNEGFGKDFYRKGNLTCVPGEVPQEKEALLEENQRLKAQLSEGRRTSVRALAAERSPVEVQLLFFNHSARTFRARLKKLHMSNSIFM